MKTIILILFIILNSDLSYSAKIIENVQSLDIMETAICTPDCPNDRFQDNPLTTVQFTSGNCLYTVFFYYRKACNLYCDLLITKIESNTGPPCNQVPSTTILNEASIAVINYALLNLTSPLNCVPDSGQCSTYWRVSKKACWGTYTGGLTGFGGFFPCDNEACCFSTFRVCNNGSEGYEIYNTGFTVIGECTNPDPYQNCLPVCGNSGGAPSDN
jgi:hypothetical protein